MKFTIAIPTYNNENTIAASIESCINQSYDGEFEVLILNNASKDKTLQVAEEFNDPKIRIVTNESTVSMYANHNACLENGLGKYIIFCHSDDKLSPDALKTLDQVLNSVNNPDKFVIWGRSHFRDYKKNWKRAGGSLGKVLVGDSCIVPSLYWGLTPSGTCFSRESMLSLGGFYDVNSRLAPSDIITMIKLALNKFNFLMLDKYLFVREDASTAHSSVSVEENLDAVVEAYQVLFRDLSTDQIEKVLNVSKTTGDIPTVFLHVMFKMKRMKKEIWLKVVATLFKRPYMLLNKNFRHLVRDLIFTRY